MPPPRFLAWLDAQSPGDIDEIEAVTKHVFALQAQRKKVVITLWSEGSRDRMDSMLRDHKLANITSVNAWRTVQATPRNEAMLAVVGMESGFETDEFAVISEQDILGDRLVRPRKASRKLDNFISEVTSLAAGDLVPCDARVLEAKDFFINAALLTAFSYGIFVAGLKLNIPLWPA